MNNNWSLGHVYRFQGRNIGIFQFRCIGVFRNVKDAMSHFQSDQWVFAVLAGDAHQFLARGQSTKPEHIYHWNYADFDNPEDMGIRHTLGCEAPTKIAVPAVIDVDARLKKQRDDILRSIFG